MSDYTIQATCELPFEDTVAAFDPGAMMRLAGGHGDLDSLAAEAGQQLRAALSAVPGSPRAGAGETTKED